MEELMKDWNKMTIEQHITHLENKFQFDSSGTAKSVYELIKAYRVKNLPQAAVTSSNFFERWSLHWKLLYYFIGGIGVGVLASYCW